MSFSEFEIIIIVYPSKTSRPFDNDAGGMAVFEATRDDAAKFVQIYDSVVSGIITHHMYKWDVLWGSE